MALYSWFSEVNNKTSERKQQVADNYINNSVYKNTLDNGSMWPIAKVKQDRRTIQAIYNGLNKRNYRNINLTKIVPSKA
ncbi:MAG: hypothetical protein OCD00_04575 [Colwellia sp.]